MKQISDVIKEIRKANCLTQKEFAKKFFVTEKTISNYENGLRNPDFNFVSKVCQEFNITMDSFFELPKAKSEQENLVLVEKNDKFAIFDKHQSAYLTPHIYDYIDLSWNYHCVMNAEDYKNNIFEQDVPKQGAVTYSAVIDNYGNLKELNDYIFHSKFNILDTCIAQCKTNGLYYVIDNEGNRLSKGYYYIKQIPSLRNFIKKECWKFDLFYAYDKGDIDDAHFEHLKRYGIKLKPTMPINSLFISGLIKDLGIPGSPSAVLTAKGEPLPITTKLVGKDDEYKFEALKDIDILADFISKYGSTVLDIAPEEVFDEGDNYEKMIKAVIKHKRDVIDTDENLDEKTKNQLLRSDMDYLISHMGKGASSRKPSLPTNELPDPKIYFNRDERIYMLFYRECIHQFYKKHFPERVRHFHHYIEEPLEAKCFNSEKIIALTVKTNDDKTNKENKGEIKNETN